MLRSCTTVDKCTNADSQCVKDCCHLEGETPIEIRIAYQQPRPQSQTLTGAGQLPPGFPPPGAYPGMGGAVYDKPYYDALAAQAWAAVRARGPGDAEKPALPRGAERLRLPPPPVSNRSHNRYSPKSQASDEFDPDTFAAPPDSGRDGQNPLAARNRGMMTQAYDFSAEDDFFPEIVRVSREGSGHTPRPEVPWTPASHRSNRSGETPQAVVRGALFPEPMPVASQTQEGDTAAGERSGSLKAPEVTKGSPSQPGQAMPELASDKVVPGTTNASGQALLSEEQAT